MTLGYINKTWFRIVMGRPSIDSQVVRSAMTCPISVSPQCVTKDFPSAAEFITVPRHVSHYHNQFKLDRRLKKACFVISNKEIFDSAIFDCWFWSSDQLFEVMKIRIFYLAGAPLNACLSIMPGGFQLLLFSDGFLVIVHCENLLGFPGSSSEKNFFSVYLCLCICLKQVSVSKVQMLRDSRIIPPSETTTFSYWCMSKRSLPTCWVRWAHFARSDLHIL